MNTLPSRPCLYSTLALTLFLCFTATAESPLRSPDPTIFSQEDALRMKQSACGPLAPVYAPLAQQIVADFDLKNKSGIGLDIGGGSGGLTVAMAQYSPLHWVNIDINPNSFPHCFDRAKALGQEGKISALFADVHALPFQDNYADCIVSRGSFWAWEDWPLAFAEIYRVLKPGANAYIGRGFARDFPLDKARAVRAAQKKGRGGPPKYSAEETARKLRECLEQLGISNYTVETPTPEGLSDLTYGVWVSFTKAEKATPQSNSAPPSE